MKKQIVNGLMVLTVSMFFAGCSVHSEPKPCGVYDDIKEIEANATTKECARTKPYQLKIKPIVGSRQDDSKVVVDMGKVQKIWIAPYKIKSTLIAAHDIYTWVQKPRFIPGESLPDPKAKTGLPGPYRKLPFVFRSEETDDGSTELTDEKIKAYANNVYKAQNDNALIEKKEDEADAKFNAVIGDYIGKGEKR